MSAFRTCRPLLVDATQATDRPWLRDGHGVARTQRCCQLSQEFFAPGEVGIAGKGDHLDQVGPAERDAVEEAQGADDLVEGAPRGAAIHLLR